MHRHIEFQDGEGISTCNPENFVHYCWVRVLVMVSVRERLLDFYTLQQKLRYIGVLDNPQSRTKNDKGQGYCILVVLKYLLNYNRKFDNPPLPALFLKISKSCVWCVSL